MGCVIEGSVMIWLALWDLARISAVMYCIKFCGGFSAFTTVICAIQSEREARVLLFQKVLTMPRDPMHSINSSFTECAF